jgi:hypothetical protein
LLAAKAIATDTRVSDALMDIKSRSLLVDTADDE